MLQRAADTAKEVSPENNLRSCACQEQRQLSHARANHQMSSRDLRPEERRTNDYTNNKRQRMRYVDWIGATFSRWVRCCWKNHEESHGNT